MNDNNLPNLLCGDYRGLAGLQLADVQFEKDMRLKIAEFEEWIQHIEATAKKHSTEIENRDEALCLYSEVVRLYQKHEIVHPREVDSLLSRIKVLTQENSLTTLSPPSSRRWSRQRIRTLLAKKENPNSGLLV